MTIIQGFVPTAGPGRGCLTGQEMRQGREARPGGKLSLIHISFVFDKTRDTFRRALYPEYKGTRSATPEPLKQQFVLLEEILADVGFKVLYSDEFEADDYAGSLVYRFRDQIPTVVMTKDHDYLQLVSDEHNVRAWMVQARQEKADELYEKYYKAYGLDGRQVNLPEKDVYKRQFMVLAPTPPCMATW